MNTQGILETLNSTRYTYDNEYGLPYYQLGVLLAQHFIKNYQYQEIGENDFYPIENSMNNLLEFYNRINPEYGEEIKKAIDSKSLVLYDSKESNNKESSLNKDTVEVVYYNDFFDTITLIHEFAHKLSSKSYVERDRTYTLEELDEVRPKFAHNAYYSEIPSIVTEMVAHSYFKDNDLDSSIKQRFNFSYIFSVYILVKEAVKDLTLMKTNSPKITFELLNNIEENGCPFTEEEFNEYLINRYGQEVFDFYYNNDVRDDLLSDDGLRIIADSNISYVIGTYVGSLYKNLIIHNMEDISILTQLLEYFKEEKMNKDDATRLHLPLESGNIEQLKNALELETKALSKDNNTYTI
jgi:hypothetical protein